MVPYQDGIFTFITSTEECGNPTYRGYTYLGYLYRDGVWAREHSMDHIQVFDGFYKNLDVPFMCELPLFPAPLSPAGGS